MSDSELPQNKKTPWHLWIIGVLATLWNSIGVMDFTMTVTRNEAYMSSFTEAQLAYYYSFPIGIYLLWGLAVLSALMGSLLLLLRQKLACRLFGVSLVSLVITTGYNYGYADAFERGGGLPGLLFSVIIFMIAVLLVIYARAMKKKGLLM